MPNQNNYDIFTFLFALITFIGYLSIIFYFVTTEDKELIDKIITGFVAWMGTIIGFYFGHKPVKEMRNEMRILSEKNEKQNLRYREQSINLDETVELYETLKQKTDKLREYLKEIKKK